MTFAMLRSLRPYLLVGFLLAAFAGEGYNDDLFGVLGVYGILTLAVLVTAVGYDRWDRHQHDRPPPQS